VVTTASGLKYEVIQEGTGKQPTLNDTVTVNYRGTLTNGKEFDSSYSRGKPADVSRGRRHQRLDRGAPAHEGRGEVQAHHSPDLAYGSRGAGGVIGPNETLVFEVELIKVN
jgi:FKBP-type peptidyl-prolyl cis-trans isomerase